MAPPGLTTDAESDGYNTEVANNSHMGDSGDEDDSDGLSWDYIANDDNDTLSSNPARQHNGALWLSDDDSGDDDDEATDNEEPQLGGSEPQADNSLPPEDDNNSSDEARRQAHGEAQTPEPVFDVKLHACQEIPRFVYRVDHPGIHSISGADGSVRARDAHPNFDSVSAFTTYVADHFVWKLRKPSPFMSTFSYLPRASQWLDMVLSNNPHYDITSMRIFVVDTQLLEDALVFDADQLATDFDVRDHGRQKPLDHTTEYLIKGSIPADAIVNVRTWGKHGETQWQNEVGLRGQ